MAWTHPHTTFRIIMKYAESTITHGKRTLCSNSKCPNCNKYLILLYSVLVELA